MSDLPTKIIIMDFVTIFCKYNKFLLNIFNIWLALKAIHTKIRKHGIEKMRTKYNLVWVYLRLPVVDEHITRFVLQILHPT
jgi:hypothetical protein